MRDAAKSRQSRGPKDFLFFFTRRREAAPDPEELLPNAQPERILPRRHGSSQAGCFVRVSGDVAESLPDCWRR
jgi:hypothetical protein